MKHKESALKSDLASVKTAHSEESLQKDKKVDELNALMLSLQREICVLQKQLKNQKKTMKVHEEQRNSSIEKFKWYQRLISSNERQRYLKSVKDDEIISKLRRDLQECKFQISNEREEKRVISRIHWPGR